MSSTVSSTLTSRLQVLIAKSFKAEKLYNSMLVNSGDSINVASLSNEVRAKEWAKTYNRLRKELNAILTSSTNSTDLIDALLNLHEGFQQTLNQCAIDLDFAHDKIKEALTRAEYAVIYKSSLDLIKFQSRLQSTQVVCDEVLALMETKKSKIMEPIELDQPINESTSGKSSKVIPFRRKKAI